MRYVISPPFQGVVVLLVAASLFCAAAGCTQHSALREPDPSTLPKGYALLIVAVPRDDLASARDLLLQISDSLRFQLEGQALNEITVPAGVHSLLLPNVTQDKSNRRLKRVFSEQE
ncbi:hypothetical protein GF324_04675, partial [bacterium]|nr:hypothetical protein [bacterium]